MDLVTSDADLQSKWASARCGGPSGSRTLGGVLEEPAALASLWFDDHEPLRRRSESLDGHEEAPDWALPLTFVYGKTIANLDLANVSGLEELGSAESPDLDFLDFDAALEPLLNATDALQPSNLSRLTRVVRDWTEEASGPTDPYITPIAVAEPEASPGIFFSLLHEAEHRLLKRRKDKDLWAWFLDWRQAAISLAEDGAELDANWLLKMLRLRRAAARRRVRRRRAPERRAAVAERLVRIAASIIPNAPPARLREEPTPTEAA